MRLKEARKQWTSLEAPDGLMSGRHSTLSRVRRSSVNLISRATDSTHVVHVYDPTTGEGIGALDFLDNDGEPPLLQSKLTEDVIEKWWCLGDVRNRVAVWVQGIRSREAFASRNSYRFFEVQSSGQSPSNPLPSSHSHHSHLSRPIWDGGPDGPCEASENRLSLLRILI